eukprot:maker-scaffold592_size129239-snap-gene-0.19 protein:Tk10855 transcript:maker-scaffold592_size129239-snap-gene-0.19-mRNA-1 annotation:"tenx_human ame: full"
MSFSMRGQRSSALHRLALSLIVLWFKYTSVMAQSTCSYGSDCDNGFQCIGATGNCMLPAFWNGPRYVECSSNKECQQNVLIISQCIIKRYGTCLPEDDLCQHVGKWHKTCPFDLYCDPSRNCINMTGIADFTIGNRDTTHEAVLGLTPNFVNFLADSNSLTEDDSIEQAIQPKETYCLKLSDCDRDQLCCPNGRCSSECFSLDDIKSAECSYLNPHGNCQTDQECREGRCRQFKCTSRKPCPDDLACVNGLCSRERTAIELPQFCSVANPFGYCESGYECRSGKCMSGNACGANNWNGVCPQHEVCKNGICVDKFHQCSKRNMQGFCSFGEQCREGICVHENQCSPQNPEGSCPASNQVCHDGACIEGCSKNNLLGFCPEAEICQLNGYCVQECSPAQPRGICPFGQNCYKGQCRPKTRCLLCLRGQLCQNGQCSDTCHKSNDKCKPDQTCNRGICVPNAQECSANDEDTNSCPEDEVCDRGYCAEEKVQARKSAKKRCSAQNPCPNGRECSFGRCSLKSKRPSKIYLPGGVTIAFGGNRKRLGYRRFN